MLSLMLTIHCFKIIFFLVDRIKFSTIKYYLYNLNIYIAFILVLISIIQHNVRAKELELELEIFS